MPKASSIMRHKIILQTLTRSQNDFGEPVEQWADSPHPLPASFEPLYGNEYWQGQNMPQLTAQIEARIRIRFREGLKPDVNRVVYGGVVYDIKTILHDRRRKEMQLMVKASAEQQQDGSKVNV